MFTTLHAGRVFFVGDVLSVGDVAGLRELQPAVGVVNYYGSTETQQALGHYVVPASPGGALPLGRGIPDVQLLVLTPGGALAGIGEVGEIVVRSPHVARGYLDDPQLTRERFTVNPIIESAADRIYRTGDLGRYLPNGDVVFAGRADRQLKIRGFRIEPAEIETVLTGHPTVLEAVVVIRDEAGDRRLVAYLTAAESGEEMVPELRAELVRRLPGYMVPSAFVVLERFPLTPTGKVDRAALPVPGELRSAGTVAPRTPVEERVAAIWRELLGVERIGVDDNFFEVGGHSLLVIRLLTRLREAFGLEVPLLDLYAAPTVAGLALYVEAAQLRGEAGDVTAGSPLVEIRTGDGGPPLFCVHPAGGMVLCYADLARHLELPGTF